MGAGFHGVADGTREPRLPWCGASRRLARAVRAVDATAHRLQTCRWENIPCHWRPCNTGAALLPEIAGSVRYRLPFGVTLAGLPSDAEWMPMLHRLRSMPLSLEDMRSGGSFRRVTPQRMLNAIYLQSGPMISRAFDTRVW